MSKPTMPIREFLTEHFAVQRDLEPNTTKQHHYIIDCVERFLNRKALMEDLNDNTVNRWLMDMQKTDLSRNSIKSKRRGLMTLWRAAFEQELIHEFPRRVRRIKCPANIPRCWSSAQLETLMAAAMATPGNWGRASKGAHIARADWWVAWILVNYNSGLRLSDMLRIERDQIMDDGRFTVVQHKTGKPIDCRLPPEAISAVDKTSAKTRKRIFGGVLNQRTIQEEFKFLLYRAKLPGSIKWLRKSGATHCEALTPGSASQFLGHRGTTWTRDS
jgi:site-specific recombinase XerD